MAQPHRVCRSRSLRGVVALTVLMLVIGIAGLASPRAAHSALPAIPKNPLRIMVPTAEAVQGLRARGVSSLTQISPAIDPARSFSPGPRMVLPHHLRGPNQIGTPSPFRTLAILVKFSDKPSQVSAAAFDSLLFDTSGNTMTTFYDATSYGLLDIVTLNLPGTLGWQQAPNPYSYYVNGDNCLSLNYPRNCQGLAEDVVKAVNAQVDFSKYDNNGDGYVDTVFIIHSGPGAETQGGNPNLIWSHSWWTYNEPLLDGVRIGSYTTEPEYLWTPGDITYGVFAHELGHALGLPDLYDIDYSSYGVGNWSLMSGGSWNYVPGDPVYGKRGSAPAQLDAWSKVYLGFANPVDVTGQTLSISLPSASQANTGIYKIRAGSRDGEYFLLENRQPYGTDKGLPGFGLLIWHVDESLGEPYGYPSNRNECRKANNYSCKSSHFFVALEQADGALDLEYYRTAGDAGDPFGNGKTAFGFATNPNTSSYYSNVVAGTEIFNISPSAGTMTAQVAPLALPTLSSPGSGAITRDGTPTFSWNAFAGASKYGIQVDNNADFSSPEINSTTKETVYTSSTVNLAGGTYYWRVRAANAAGAWGAWSASWTVVIDKTKPAAPDLVAPADGASVSVNSPTLDWGDVADAATYELQLDNNADFSSLTLAVTVNAPTSTYTPTLADGVYYWRVRAYDVAGNKGVWSAIWDVRVDAIPTTPPVLAAPAEGSITRDSTPTFTWNAVADEKKYKIQVDDQSDFSSPAVNATTKALTYTPTTALTGTNVVYYWRVQAQGLDGAWSAFGPYRSFLLDKTKPAVPTLELPGNKSVMAEQPTFNWADVADPDLDHYSIQLDNNSDFSSPFVTANTGTVSQYTHSTALNGKTYWRVRSFDRAGNKSAWSPTWTVTVSAAPVSTDVALLTVESDQAAVRQGGAWTPYDSVLASGGRYVFSSGTAGDSLMLGFTGTQVDIVYVKHPALGTFAVEVDGVLLQTITTTAAETTFGARVSIGYLPEGAHTLKVYATEGTVAIDSFAVAAVADIPATPEPTISPTVEATIEMTPTVEPTVAVTEQATAEPPTATPLPPTLGLPFYDPFDGGLGWTASGSWQADTQTAHSGAGWFAEAVTRGQTSILTGEFVLDLTDALYPQMSFWQKMSLTAGDTLAVDISLDGGLTWLPLDAQVGAVGDWTLHTLDLSAYRGAVIRLRFRLDTFGVVPDDQTPFGWWLDELAVQEVPPATPTPLPTDTPLPTSIPPTATPLVPTEIPTGTPTAVMTETPTEMATEAATEQVIPAS